MNRVLAVEAAVTLVALYIPLADASLIVTSV